MTSQTSYASSKNNLSWIKVHRRSKSCDASKSLERKQLNLTMERNRHQSLKRKSPNPTEQQPSSGGSHAPQNWRYSMSQPVPSSGRYSQSSFVEQSPPPGSSYDLNNEAMVSGYSDCSQNSIQSWYYVFGFRHHFRRLILPCI